MTMKESELLLTHALPDQGVLLRVYPGYVVAISGDGRRRRATDAEVKQMHAERAKWA